MLGTGDYLRAERARGLPDAMLQEEINGFRQWAEEQIRDGTPHDYVRYLYHAMTDHLAAELGRRKLRRLAAQGGTWLTTAALVAKWPERLRAAGRGRYWALCPWHDDHSPSLLVYDDDWCHCFVDGGHRSVSELDREWSKP